MGTANNLGSPEQQFVNQVLPGVLDHNSVDRVVQNIAKNPYTFYKEIANQKEEVKHLAHEYSAANGGKAPDPIANKDFESISIIEPPHFYDSAAALLTPNGDSANRSSWRDEARTNERILLNQEMQAEWKLTQGKGASHPGTSPTVSPAIHHSQSHAQAKASSLPDHVKAAAAATATTINCTGDHSCEGIQAPINNGVVNTTINQTVSPHR